MKKVSTDVLIIGGGLAAIMAALEASAFPLSVLMASKGKVGRSGATLMAGSNFAAVLPEGLEQGDTVQFHIDDTLAGGGYLNDPKLVRTLAENAARDLLFLEELGVNFLKRDGRFELRSPPGHRYPRTVFTSNPGVPIRIRGKTIMDPLMHVISGKGIRCLDGVSVLKLAVQDGCLSGAIAIDKKKGEIILIECRAAVIASGAAGNLYENTTNPNDLTGDSYSLALEAGCALRDLEFIQFFPTVHLDAPRVTLYSPLLGDGAVLRNQSGERFLARYEPERMELATRDTVSQAIYREIQEGRGIEGGVYLDLSAIPFELLSFRFPDLIQLFREHGVDLKKDWIRVAPAVHFCMGGVAIDERCRTSIQGLYGAGEATGGVHGVNRLSGNGLSDPLVFGRIAGREAAIYARDNLKHETRGEVQLETVQGEYFRKRSSITEVQISEARKRVRRLMWEKVGIIRNRAGLVETLEELESIQVSLRGGPPASEKDLAHYCELRSMLTSALAIGKAALFREESRGAHSRDDFPESRKDMAKSIYVTLSGSQMSLSFENPRV